MAKNYKHQKTFDLSNHCKQLEIEQHEPRQIPGFISGAFEG